MANKRLYQGSRRIVEEKFKPGGSQNFRLATGQVIKKSYMTIMGKMTTNAYTGTMIMHRDGFAAALVKTLELVLDQGKNIRTLTPEWLLDQALMVNGTGSPRYYKANSQILTDAPSSGVPSTLAASQTISFIEQLQIPLECVLCNTPVDTALSLLGLTDSRFEVSFNEFSKLNQGGSSTDFAITSYDITVSIHTTNSPDLVGENFRTWKQFENKVTYSNSQNETLIPLNLGNHVLGFGLSITGGDNEVPITLDDAKKMKFKVLKNNGEEVVKDFTMHELMLENVADKTLREIIPGTAYCTFLNNRDIRTALDTAEVVEVQKGVFVPVVKNLFLSVSIPNPSDLAGAPKDVRIAIRQDDVTAR